MMTSVDFLEFFTQLSILAKQDDKVTLSKSTRLQVYNGDYVTIPTYSVTHDTGTDSQTVLTIGELCIAPQNFVYYLYLANEFEIEPDSLATGENYDTALNFFTETYNERRATQMNALMSAKTSLEERQPELVFAKHEEVN